MSRMRQIPVMDVTQRERMMQQTQPVRETMGMQSPMMCHPQSHPIQPVRPRVRKAPMAKFRLSDTPALIAGGCHSVRQLCNSVQNITVDLNNLVGSVESMVPLLNTYVTVLQSRNAIAEQDAEPPIEVSAKESSLQNREPSAAFPPSSGAQSHNSAAANAPVPRPEDIQALLENPLVRNLLNGFMQNSAFPHAGAAKENTLNQSQF